MKPHDDHRLLEAFARKDDEQAFRALVERYTNLVFGTALRICRNRGLAEEVAQNVFTALAKRADVLDASGGIGGWLHRTTCLEAKNLCRREKRYRDRMNKYSQQVTSEDDETVPLWESVLPLLDEALAKLSANERRILVLHYYEKLTFAQIAEHLKAKPATVQKRSIRAVAKLADILRGHGVAITATALGAGMAAEFTRAAPSGLAASLGNHVLTNVSLTTSAATFLSVMNVGKGAAFAAVFVFAAALPPSWLGLQARASHARTMQTSTEEIPIENSPRESRVASPTKLPLDLAALRRELMRLIANETVDHDSERTLRQLMFALELEEIPGVVDLFETIENTKRAHKVVLSLFSRWAELDPRAAVKRASLYDADRFGAQPIQGAFLTWAAMDWESASAWIIAAETPFDEEWLARRAIGCLAASDPHSALAHAEDWRLTKPEWHDAVITRIVDHWIRNEPQGAIDWLLEIPDEVARESRLGDALVALGERKPRLAMETSREIGNPSRRTEIMATIQREWNWRSPEDAFEYFIEMNGFETWPPPFTNSAGEFLARVHPEQAVEFAKTMENGEPRDRFLLGILSGASLHDPSQGADAIALISDQALSDHKERINGFLSSWKVLDANAANQWLATVPEERREAFRQEVTP